MTVVKAIGVLSVAKISGVIGVLVGLVFGIPFGLIVYFTDPVSGAVGLVLVAGLPLLYGLLGFLGGALYAWLYNIVARWVGGIEVDLSPE